MIAQASLDSLPAGWLRYGILFSVAIVMLACAVSGSIFAGLQYLQSKRPQDRQITPQPLLVAEAANYVHKSEFDEFKDATDKTQRDLFSKVGGVERGAASRLEERMKAAHDERRDDMRMLHHEINEVGRKVAGLETSTQIQNQTLASVTSDVKRILERLPRNS